MQPAITIPSIKLKNGRELPMIGLGTYQMKGEACAKAVTEALKQGYRHIDTASIYRNEEDVAKGIADSGVARKDIFITSKVGPGEQGYEEALAAFAKTTSKLGTDYLDLYLIHWPGVQSLKMTNPRNAKMRAETWRALEKLYDEGKCRAIGVSNYDERHLKELLAVCRIKPMVDQLEHHPRLQRSSLVKFCKDNDIVFEAYTSLGDGKLVANEKIVAIAAAVHKTPAQVLLRWAVQRGIPVLPKSIHAPRIIENLDILSWSLTEEHMATLAQMEDNKRYCWDSTDVL